jgi:hypothetical protein
MESKTTFNIVNVAKKGMVCRHTNVWVLCKISMGL